MEKVITIPNGILALLITGAITGLILTGNLYSKEADKIQYTNEPEYNAFIQSSVYISGAVNNPGVYQFMEGMRIRDIVERAGGFSEVADTNFITKELNLSEVLTDQQHIFIPGMENETDSTSEVMGEVSGKISINNATIQQLDELPGVGPVTANNIINNRPYSTLEDLLNVPGIGNATFEKLKPLITL